MRRICVVITARPSYSRVKTALDAIHAHPDLQLDLVVAASALLERYGSAVDQIRADGFDIAAQVHMVLEGENPVAMAKTTGIGLLELASALDNLAPDAVVTVADRYETLASAIAASYLNIPLVHIQGGEVTGSIDEKVRHAVTKLADLHLVSTDLARERVIRMGEHAETVHVTGCPSIDLAADVAASPTLDFDPFARYGGVGAEADLNDGYIVVLQHPVTTEHEEARAQITSTLHAVTKARKPAIWFWPNVDAGSDGTSKGIRHFREVTDDVPIHFFRGMAPLDFLRLVVNSSCLVGNSSAGIRECSYLGVPVVNIGPRQRGRERGRNVMDVDHHEGDIADAIDRQSRAGRYPSDLLYGDGAAGERIADVLATAPLGFEKQLAY